MEESLLQWTKYVPPLVGVIFGIYLRWFYSLWVGLTKLRPRAGKYCVYRKSGERFPHINQIKVTWHWKRPMQLSYGSEKSLRDYEQGASGVVYFRDGQFGTGFYKGNNSSYYGLAKFLLFPDDEIGYFRTYIRDDDSKPHLVSTSQEVLTQFVLKREE